MKNKFLTIAAIAFIAGTSIVACNKVYFAAFDILSLIHLSVLIS
jgi:hypothetical protein